MKVSMTSIVGLEKHFKKIKITSNSLFPSSEREHNNSNKFHLPWHLRNAFNKKFNAKKFNIKIFFSVYKLINGLLEMFWVSTIAQQKIYPPRYLRKGCKWNLITIIFSPPSQSVVYLPWNSKFMDMNAHHMFRLWNSYENTKVINWAAAATTAADGYVNVCENHPVPRCLFIIRLKKSISLACCHH